MWTKGPLQLRGARGEGGAEPGAPRPPPSRYGAPGDAFSPSSEVDAPATGASLEIVLSGVSVDDASSRCSTTKARLMTVEDADFTSAIRGRGRRPFGAPARQRSRPSTWATSCSCRGVSAPLEVSTEVVKLDADGGEGRGRQARGDVTVDLKDGFRYMANVDVKDVDVKTLLQEAKSGADRDGPSQGGDDLRGHGRPARR